MDPLKHAAFSEPTRSISGISIVIPAFNEEKAIKETIDCCQKLLAAVPYRGPHEIVVIDDGSSDRTDEIVKETGVRLIRHLQNLGYGKSLKDGIAAAQNDTILISDADGSYAPESAALLLDRFTQGYHLVIGRRQGGYYYESWYKWPMRHLLQWIVEFVVGRKVPDVNSGFRVFSRAELIPYFSHLCDTFSFTTSQTLAYFMTHKSVMFVPISYEKRIGRTKVKLFRDALRTMQYIVQTILYFNPLKIFILMSIACLFLGVLGVLVTVASGVKMGYFIGLGAIISSIIVFSIGLLAEQLRQILLQSNH
jgi:polyisoprenyl-phosphate glycosyltransferase